MAIPLLNNNLSALLTIAAISIGITIWSIWESFFVGYETQWICWWWKFILLTYFHNPCRGNLHLNSLRNHWDRHNYIHHHDLNMWFHLYTHWNQGDHIHQDQNSYHQGPRNPVGILVDHSFRWNRHSYHQNRCNRNYLRYWSTLSPLCNYWIRNSHTMIFWLMAISICRLVTNLIQVKTWTTKSPISLATTIFSAGFFGSRLILKQ